MRDRYFPQLDGIRAVAIAAVMSLHASYGFVRGGFLGVDLFFVLSGFLITFLLVEEAEQFGKIWIGSFYLRRFLRLYPALLITVVATGLAWDYMPGTEVSYSRMALAALFYYANSVPQNSPLHHTWSLSIEEQFYLLWPFALLMIVRLKRWRFLPPLVIIALAVCIRNFMIARHVPPWQISPFPPARMDSLMTGALIALVITNRSLRACLSRITHLYGPMGAIALGISATLFFTIDQYNYALYAWEFSGILLLFGILIASIVLDTHKTSWTNYLLSSRPMVYLGRRSYGIYLYHLPIFYWLENFRVHHSSANFVIITALRFALSIGVAALSYRFVEKPILRYKSHFERHLSGEQSPKAA